MVDLVTMKAWVWDESGLPENYEIGEIPEDMKAKAAEYREMMIETALEQDDDLLEAYLDGDEPALMI